MGTLETNGNGGSKWMIFIRIITVLGIPVGSWIVRTTMNTDKNVSLMVERFLSLDQRVQRLERTDDLREQRYVDDLKNRNR